MSSFAIDLSRWNLTIPVDAEIIQTEDLQTYASPWFIRNADGSITFFAPSSGDGISSTENSTYPRSELRETLLNGDDREANWPLGSAPLHRLSATLRVDSLAASGKAIIGQFHGEGSKVPVKIQVTRISGTDRFKVYLQNKPTMGGTEYKPYFAAEIAMGEVFGYDLSVTADGVLSCTLSTASSSEVLTAQFDVDSYADDTWYAKAGMYSQEVVGGEGAGQATFFALQMFHGEAPATEQPVDPAAPAEPLPESPVLTRDDVLVGAGGDDILDGGPGKDRLAGGAGGDVFRFAARTDSYRTDSASFSDLIGDFDPEQDAIDLSALGFTGLGDGRNGTLLVQTNADGSRTYLKSYDADAEGRRFEVALDGNHAAALVAGSNIWFSRDDAIRWHLSRADIYRAAVTHHLEAIEAICSAA